MQVFNYGVEFACINVINEGFVKLGVLEKSTRLCLK